MARPLSISKRLVFAAIPVLVAYLVLETAASAMSWACWWDSSMWLFEDSGRTWHFDAIRGYRLTSTPSRFTRITNGTIEYVGTARGNTEGFPDRDDFGPQRPAPGVRRIAVFGDSFTEAQYLGQNWPDRAEDLARARGEPMQFLNFAVSGGGLANWWSILTKLVAADDYQIDGVIFAVFPGDLRRTFSMWEHRGSRHPFFGRTPGWDPATFPNSLGEARPYLKEHPALILSPESFERTLQGTWPREVPRRLRPYFLTKAWRILRSFLAARRDQGDEPAPGADPGRNRLITDIRRILQERGLPALVILLPERSSVLDPTHAPIWPVEETKAFAHDIGATFLDATSLFAGMGRAQIKAQYLPYDGHWNQSGSNRFAEFVLGNLDRIPEERSATHRVPEDTRN